MISREDFHSLIEGEKIENLKLGFLGAVEEIINSPNGRLILVRNDGEKETHHFRWGTDEAIGTDPWVFSDILSHEHTHLVIESVGDIIQEWLEEGRIFEKDAARLRRASSHQCRIAAESVMFH